MTPTWLGAMVAPDPVTGAQPFDLYAGGSYCGRFALKVPGAHNVRNAVGAIAACAEGFGVGVAAARTALASFALFHLIADERKRHSDITRSSATRACSDRAHADRSAH